MRLLWLALLCVGCGQRDEAPVPEARSGDHYAGPMNPARDSEVVASVNGERIYAVDVARQMAARGQTAEQAVAELVSAELLAQEAFRRGLADDP